MANDLPTPNDTLIARYAGPIRVGMTGDPGVAGSYVNVARVGLGQLRNSLALGGITDGVWRFQSPDGARISVARVAGMDIVHIDVTSVIPEEEVEQISRFFLESGFIRINDFLFIVEGQPVGRLYYSQQVLDVYQRWDKSDAEFADHPAGDVPWLDYLDMMTVAADGAIQAPGINPYRFETRTYEAGMNSEAVSVMPEGQIKQAKWLTKDISAATGKMLLFLQVQLGRYHTKGADFLENYGATPTLFVTHGLMTLSDYTYLLLRISLGSVFWKPITINETLRQILIHQHGRASESDWKRLEGYALTTATIDAAASWTEVVMPDAVEVKGNPFYYGWKANWAGDEWAVVTNEPIYDGARIVFHTARRYRIQLEVQRDKTGAMTGLTGSLTRVEEENYTPRVGVDVLWYPDPTILALVPFVPITSAGLGYPKLLAGDAPVYCWYDDADKLVVIRHILSEEKTKLAFNVTLDWSFEGSYGVYSSISPDNQPLCAPNKVIYDDWKAAGPFRTGGYYLTRDNLEHDSKDFLVAEAINNKTTQKGISDYTASGVVVHDGTSSTTVAVTCSPGPVWPETHWHSLAKWTTSEVEMLEEGVVADVTTDSVLVIPFLSSESGFLIGRQYERGTFSTLYRTGSTIIKGESLEGDSYVPLYTMYWRGIAGEDAGFHIYRNISASGWTGKTEVKGWLFAKHHEQIIPLDDFIIEYRTGISNDYNNSEREYVISVVDDEAITTGTAESLGPLHDLFNPNLFGGGISTYSRVNVLESVNGDLYYPKTLRDREETVSDELLPRCGYGGLFSGWA